jgi:hypothetical protein
MTSPIPDPAAEIVAILARGPAAKAVVAALRDEHLHLRLHHADEDRSVWRDTRSAEAVLVDESIDPRQLQEARERGWIRATVPIFVVAQRLPEREEYGEWLNAGAWDVLKIPLECTALAVRLRNILDGSGSGESLVMRRYSLDVLERVADESVALARRYARQLHCLAVRLEDADEDSHPAGLPERLAGEVEYLVRGADLVGIGDSRTIFVLLPDTAETGIAAFMDRVTAQLEPKLAEWGVEAAIRMASASASEAESGREILSLVSQRVNATPL